MPRRSIRRNFCGDWRRYSPHAKKVTDREYSVAKPGPKGENLPIGNLAIKDALMIRIATPQDLGHAVRAARKQLGLTQAQLSLAAGVGLRFIVDLGGRQAHAPSRACTARRRFTRWRIHLEWVCVKPFGHCTSDRQCARCQGGSASGLGRAHCAGPRTQDGIRVASHIYSMEDRGAVPRTAPYWV